MTNTSKQKLAKKIESFCWKLPTYQLWEQYRKTHDLSLEYWRLKGEAGLLGRNLKARFLGGGGNPARQAEQKGLINNFERRLIEAQVDVFDVIFSLLQTAWEDIKTATSNISDPCLQTERAFFCAILREHFDTRYTKAARGYKFTTRQALARAEILGWRPPPLCEIQPLTSQQRKQLGLEQVGNDFFYLPFLLTITEDLSKNDDAIAKHYLRVWEELKHFTNVQKNFVIESRKTSDPSKRTLSVKWSNGNFYVGSKGGYKRGFVHNS